MAQAAPRFVLAGVAIVVVPERDNVAVARRALAAGVSIDAGRWGEIVLRGDVPAGHRFALCAIGAGEWLYQYGQPFARSRGIEAGAVIGASNVENDVPRVNADEVETRPMELAPWTEARPTFLGFVRPDGRVGVRNWVLVVPTSMCSSHEATTIALRAEMSGLWNRQTYPNVDGATSIGHTRGCGCPDYEPGVAGDRLMGAVEATMGMLENYIAHPNVGAVLLIELGCEKTNLAAMEKHIGATTRLAVIDAEGIPAGLSALARRHGKPVATLSVQQSGGTQGTIRRGLEMLPALLEEANRARREACDVSALCLGLKCGGSDAFSGLSANPALGAASDLLIRAGGSSIITEISEFFGAEHLFAARARDRAVAKEIFATMERFRRYVARAGGSMMENPSPGNREGGLINIAVKSLGAIAKSGSAPVQGVLEYGQQVRGRGLWLLYGPSYDQESTPALVGSGCQMVCFTTGRGTGIGNAIAPVIKIASNSNLAKRMAGDIDFDAGVILDGADLDEVGRRLFDLILRTASGERVRAEENGHREFTIWSEEGVSL